VSEDVARYGWQSDLPSFVQVSPSTIEAAVLAFVRDASAQQRDSWHDSVRWLQRECERCLREESSAETFFTLLEYVETVTDLFLQCGNRSDNPLAASSIRWYP
jgi:hypothetical protein